MRSVFSAGLLDGFLQQQFNPFDFYIGVSGGAGNLVAYLSGRIGLSLELFLQVAQRREFISYRRFLGGGDLVDINWLVDFVFSFGELPLQRISCAKRPLFITVTDVDSGEADFISASAANLQTALAASMSLPLLSRKFPVIDGRPRTDGGVAANIPVAEAIARGAEKIMVVRSRPDSYIKRDTLGHRLIRWRLRRHRQLVETMRQRPQLHRETVALMQAPPANIEIVDICPPEDFSAGRFTRNIADIRQGYRAGLDAAEDAASRWAGCRR